MNIYFFRKLIGVQVESSEKFIEQAFLPEIKTFRRKNEQILKKNTGQTVKFKDTRN